MVKQLTPEEALRRVERQMAANRERAAKNAKAVRLAGWKRLVLLVPPGKSGEQVAEAIKALHRQLVNDAGLKPPTAASRKRERTAGSVPSGATVAPTIAQGAPVAPKPPVNPVPQQETPAPLMVRVPEHGDLPVQIKVTPNGVSGFIELLTSDRTAIVWRIREEDLFSHGTPGSTALRPVTGAPPGTPPIPLTVAQITEIRRMVTEAKNKKSS